MLRSQSSTIAPDGTYGFRTIPPISCACLHEAGLVIATSSCTQPFCSDALRVGTDPDGRNQGVCLRATPSAGVQAWLPPGGWLQLTPNQHTRQPTQTKQTHAGRKQPRSFRNWAPERAGVAVFAQPAVPAKGTSSHCRVRGTCPPCGQFYAAKTGPPRREGGTASLAAGGLPRRAHLGDVGRFWRKS